MISNGRIWARSGQASVELIAAVPVLAIVLAGAWQTVVAGHAVWTAAEASRLGAREYAVHRRREGSVVAGRRARALVARVLPSKMRAKSRVDFDRSGAIAVRVRVPLVFPFSVAFARGPGFVSRTKFAA